MNCGEDTLRDLISSPVSTPSLKMYTHQAQHLPSEHHGLFLPNSSEECIIHLPCHVANFSYSWQVQGYGGSTDVQVMVGVLPKACCHLQVVLSLLHHSAGCGYKAWGCKSSVLKQWGVSGFIEFRSLLKDCLLKVYTFKSQRRCISPSFRALIKISPQTQTGCKFFVRGWWDREKIYSHIHSRAFII